MKHFIQKLLWKYNYDLSKIHYTFESLDEFIKFFHPIKLEEFSLKRFGNQNGDGGYILPDDLKNIKYLFSLGVGNLTSFESDLKTNNIKCFLADASVDGKNLLEKGFEFQKKFIRSYNSSDSLRFETWKKICIGDDYNSEIILQIDIEGDEYNVIPTLSDSTLKQTKYLIVEYHFLTKIFDKKINNLIFSSLRRISEYFYPLHLNVNNTSAIMNIGSYSIPHCLEVSYINKRFINHKIIYLNDGNDYLNKPNTLKKQIKVPDIFFKKK